MWFPQKLKAFILLLFIIITKNIPGKTGVLCEYLPELFPLFLQVICLIKKDLLGITSIFFLSLADDFLKMSFTGVSTAQNLVYLFLIEHIRKKYVSHILLDWLIFSILSTLFLSLKYAAYNLIIKESEIHITFFLKKIFATIIFFPFAYNFIHRIIYKQSS